MNRLIYLFVASLIGTHLMATDPLLSQGDRLFVVAHSGVNARAYPSTDHSVLFGVGYGEKVEVIEANMLESECIDDLTGYWIKVAYGNQVGYVFDAYLSKLPPLEIEDLVPSDDYIDRIKNYALMQLGPSMPKVTYNNLVDGESAFKIDIHNLKKGCQYVEYTYWEGMDAELQLTDLRNVEMKYLLAKLFHDNANFDPSEVPGLDEGKTIQFSSEEGYYVTIRKLDNRYSIFLEVGSCC